MAQRVHASADANREHVMGLLDLALRVRPDVVCLPETFAIRGGGAAEADAEPLDGPSVAAAGKRAREHRCYVVCPVLTKRDGRYFNSAAIIDRTGHIAGVYDKARPVTTSHDYTVFEGGVTPGPCGEGLPVFDLDFGRVGVQICFDACFPEQWEQLGRAGVRLVFWPSAYNGGMSLRAHATRNRCYVVSSVRATKSRVIDPLGQVLAETNAVTPVAWRDVNLDFVVCHYDFNYAISDRILAAYGDRVDVRTDWDDQAFLVEPRDPAVTTAALQAEFGFESAAQYFQRHRYAAPAARAGEPCPPQQAAHGDRPMYTKS